MIISIDGLGVNGKSTLAKIISEKLGFRNFNTGSIYRCIALEILNKNIDINNISSTIKKLEKIKIDFRDDKVFLNNEDVTKVIRTEKISMCAVQWATISEIKQIVRNIQRDFVKKYNTVIEGRDIGSRIVPEADVKFYLYSDFETRVKRLWKQNTSININIIRENLTKRDDIDINGGNFKKPENAVEIDTTNKSIDEIFDIMMNKINEVRKYNENRN